MEMGIYSIPVTVTASRGTRKVGVGARGIPPTELEAPTSPAEPAKEVGPTVKYIRIYG